MTHAYFLGEGGAERVQPIASTPRGFVEEWLTAPWEEVGPWSEQNYGLLAIHERLRGDKPAGEFLRTSSCEEPHVVEVGLLDYSVSGLEPVPEMYFKVQSSAPGVFHLLEVGDSPSEGCEPRED